jgi:hypothetical protein
MEYPEGFDSFVVMKHDFFGIRVLDNRLQPAVFNLKVSVSSTISQDEAGIAWEKMRIFLDSCTHGVIMIDYNSDLLPGLEIDTDNNIMYVPGQPDDLVLASLLHAKLTAIAGDGLIVDCLILSSSDNDYADRHFRCESGNYTVLPGIEYIGEETLNENPWWMRPTIEISDYATDDPAYVEYVKEHDPLQYVGQQKIEEEAQIIVIDKWKKTDE